MLGIPLALGAILGYGNKYNFLAHPRFLRVFGFLYTKFDVEYFWWELTFLLRRFVMCVLVVFLEVGRCRLSVLTFALREIRS